MSVDPVISVVVSTYNRAETLRGAIASLLALSPESPPHEIIIVDNNSKDHTREVVESMIPASGGRLRYVFEGKQGASHGRNAGSAVARGEFLAFTDDDVRPAPTWLVAIGDVFAAHPEIAYVGGPVRPIWPSEPPAWLTDWFWSPLALIDYGEAGEAQREPFRCFVTANMAIRRSVFETVGRLDPRYQHAPGAVTSTEDHEVQIRLLDAGYRGWYDPAVEMRAEVQPNRLTLAYHRRWAFDHGRAIVRMTPPGMVFDGHSSYVPESPTMPHVFGAPARLFKRVLVLLSIYPRRLGASRRQDRLWLQFKTLEYLGMIREYIATRDERTTKSRPPRPLVAAGSAR